ncbi:hypothetical protein KIH74_35210 [Kineosporia sp. J2-2]|uniref:PE family protein n=1 Tax=Kineosporia corallincola TaxID=2835133 RepID=A0ABS5TTX4_9ACTN|nr:hypothetical protein [Kineosporia corallincola]MBT0774246.1 hypothetical protein [Kineosporia corallincola]
MSDFIEQPADLKARLSKLDDVSGYILALADKLAQINELNKTAGGTDDAPAHAYHAQIDQPTALIVDLTQTLGEVFGVKAEASSAAADVLDRSSELAKEIAASAGTSEKPSS